MKSIKLFIVMTLFLFSSLISMDFIRLVQVKESLKAQCELVHDAIRVSESPSSFLPKNYSYVCHSGCTYEKESIIEYSLLTSSKFLLSLGETTVSTTFSYYYSDTYFHT